MKTINLHITADKTKKAEKVSNYLTKQHGNSSAKKCNYIVVIGGDGFMLHCLKKYQKYNKPFYGINTGNRGFLLNKFENGNIIFVSDTNSTVYSSIKISFEEFIKLVTNKSTSFLVFPINGYKRNLMYSLKFKFPER